MDLYTLLRILVMELKPSIHGFTDEEVRLIKASAWDLIDQLKATQALGSLSSDMRGQINVKL